MVLVVVRSHVVIATDLVGFLLSTDTALVAILWDVGVLNPFRVADSSLLVGADMTMKVSFPRLRCRNICRVDEHFR